MKLTLASVNSINLIKYHVIQLFYTFTLTAKVSQSKKLEIY